MNYIVFALYAGLVAYLSLLPTPGPSIEHLDKVEHLAVYFVFAVLGYRTAKDRRGFLLVCLGIIAYSALLEIAQSFTPGRQMSAYDLLANSVGVSLGAALMLRRRKNA